MNDPTGNRGWLVLIHQLPPKPDYLRVKVRRKLQRIGAIALKNTVYVLPDNDEAREDFRWLRREILTDGGEAMLMEAEFIEGVTSHSLERLSRAERDQEYRELVVSADAIPSPTASDYERLQRQIGEIIRRDHFGAAGRDTAEFSLRNLRARTRPSAAPASETSRPRGATWVTRQGVKIDRMASAWLIRGWIDPDATFRFVPPDGYEPAAGEIRFDMFEGEFTHIGDRCTFEVLVHHFALTEPSLVAIAEIVHDVDCKDGKFGRAEANGVAAMIDGIVLTTPDDAARLAAGAALFANLRASLARAGT